jgi:hypothetical protein
MRLSCRELPIMILLLVDDARDSYEELLDLLAESFVAFAIILYGLKRHASSHNQR